MWDTIAMWYKVRDYANLFAEHGMNFVTATYTNALTSLSVQAAKIPIHFETDREVVERALRSLGLADVGQAKVIRIRDTLSLAELEVSETDAAALRERPDLEPLSAPAEMAFDRNGDLISPTDSLHPRA